MCYPEKCPRCGKTGWAGCGEHVDDVMRSIPPAQRCTCDSESVLEPRSANGARWTANTPMGNVGTDGDRRQTWH